jgi:hypothetical protein
VVDAAAEMVRRLDAMEVGAVLPLTAARYHATAVAGAGRLAEARSLAEDALRRAVDAGVVHEEGLLLDLLLGLDVVEGREPDVAAAARRDEIWRRLGIREVFRYPQLSPSGSGTRH